MTIYQIHNYYIGVFMYKLYHKQLPPMFDMFERTTNVHNYATRQYDSFYINYVPTLRTQRTIKITGPKLWNIVIRKIDIHCKIGTFKTKLKKIILSESDLS